MWTPECFAELSGKEKSVVKCRRDMQTENRNLGLSLKNISGEAGTEKNKSFCSIFFFFPAYLDYKADAGWSLSLLTSKGLCSHNRPCTLITLVILTNSNWIGQLYSLCFWMCGGCNRKWCTVIEKNQQYSFMSMSMLLYILIILYIMYIKHVHTLKSILLPLWYNRTLMWMF